MYFSLSDEFELGKPPGAGAGAGAVVGGGGFVSCSKALCT